MWIQTIAVTCALAFLPPAATAQTLPADELATLPSSAVAVPVHGPDPVPASNHSPAAQRRKDSLWNGVIIGAVVGAVVGTVVSFIVTDCSECAGFNVPLTLGVRCGCGGRNRCRH